MQSPVLDFLMAPEYRGDAGLLLGTAVDTARSRGARLVRACMAGCDRGKAAVVLEAGFRREATLAGQLAAGADCFDLHIYVLNLL